MTTSSASQSSTRLSAQINHAGKPTNSEHQEMTLPSAVKFRSLTRLLKFLRVLSKCEVKISLHSIKKFFVTVWVHLIFTKTCHLLSLPSNSRNPQHRHLTSPNPLPCSATDVCTENKLGDTRQCISATLLNKR